MIAVLMTNDQAVDHNLAKYPTTAYQAEKLTGLRFFSALPLDLAETLRDHPDEVKVPVPTSRNHQGKRTGEPA